MTLGRMDQKGSFWTSGGTVHGVPQVYTSLSMCVLRVADGRLFKNAGMFVKHGSLFS